MALRKIIRIDEELCNGCGECVPACAEGAIQIIDGKARLVADNLCDGLGACLGDCPMDAIIIEEREADAFDEEAVKLHLHQQSTAASAPSPLPIHISPGGGGGCPGSRAIAFSRDATSPQLTDDNAPQPSTLQQWPIQMHLVSPTAPYYHNADVLLAADCVAFSVGDFHRTWLHGKALAIACPKLDEGLDIYVTKLAAMIDQAQIRSLTVMMMEVPCCGGLLQIARRAAERATRSIPMKRIVVGLRGDILSEAPL